MLLALASSRALRATFTFSIARFFAGYFTWRQVAFIGLLQLLEVWLLGASQLNTMLFWALPGLLSALQLFVFGTYLPHRPETMAFADGHNARTNAYPVWLSLLTCYHFGYHHEHHLFPGVPWWRLPGVRRTPPPSEGPAASSGEHP